MFIKSILSFVISLLLVMNGFTQPKGKPARVEKGANRKKITDTTGNQQTANGSGGHKSFTDYQKSFPLVAEVFRRKEDTLQKQFEAKGLQWPAKYMYIRSFKYDSQLEVWVKNDRKEAYKLFKTYRVCALAGTLGPKRMEGDYQVPEGFYYINEFNPRSNYHLSLGINYPNSSDKVLGDTLQPGGDIYIHGSCTTVGCIPIMDAQIEELYIISTHARNQGQDFIPVHIFPIRFNIPRSMDYLARLTKDDQEMQKFSVKLKEAFDYFEKNKQLPLVTVNKKGEYSFLN
jgi:murein L,D-transpeptidase YafK